MHVTNIVEESVNHAITESRGITPDPETCRCPLCVADITALALSWIPPYYCTRNPIPWEAAGGGTEAVSRAVAKASAKIAGSPRHSRFEPEMERQAVMLVNFILEELAVLTARSILEDEGSCFCTCCTDDMMAYALNRYPPKYSVTWKGESNFPFQQKESISRELAIILERARIIVLSRPNHGKGVSLSPVRSGKDAEE